MTDFLVIEQYEGKDRTIDAYEDVASIVDTLPDDDRNAIAEVAKEAIESPGDTFDFVLPDSTIEYRSVTPLERVMMRTDTLDGYEIMQQVVTTILDREDDEMLTVEAIVAYLNEDDGGPDLLYMDVIGPAIDRCEERIRHATIVRHLKEEAK